MRRALVSGALLFACARIGGYECSDDAQCSTHDGGRCEDTGYCSYPDADCPSMRRYGEHAGALSGACTQPAAVDATTIASGSTSPADESGPAGRLEATAGSTGELPHGEPVWQFFHDGRGGDDAFNAVVAIAGEGFFVAGEQAVADSGLDVLLARYDGPDQRAWLVTFDGGLGGTDTAYGLVLSSAGTLFATGQRGVESGIEAWIGAFQPEDGGDGWSQLQSAPGVVGRDVAYTVDGRVVAVGAQSFSGGGFVALHYNYGPQIWAYPVADVELVAVSAFGDSVVVGGRRLGQLYLATADEAGLVDIAVVPGPASGPDLIQDVVRTEDDVFAVGYVATQTSLDRWLGRFPIGREPGWEFSEGDPAYDEELEALVVDGAGDVCAVGFVTEVDKDSFVACWSPAGELRWSRADFELSDGDDIARDVAITDDGQLLVVGEARTPAGMVDGYAMRLVP
jgi:hypothetical protein